MRAARFSKLQVVLGYLRALVAGIATATILVTGSVLIEALAEQRGLDYEPLLDWQTQTFAALIYSFTVAVLLAAVCAPLWLLLEKWRLDRWYVAAALGFTAVLLYWIFVFSDIETTPAAELSAHAFLYALCGAAAGLVTWRFRPRS